MATDITIAPWDRLAKLAPPDASSTDLQAAADRHGLRADVYAAAADLWEDKAYAIVTDDVPSADSGLGAGRVVQSVTQDGISVTYASDPLAGDGNSARSAQRQQCLNIAASLRKRSKPKSPLVHSPDYNPWLNRERIDPEIFVVVDEI